MVICERGSCNGKNREKKETSLRKKRMMKKYKIGKQAIFKRILYEAHLDGQRIYQK